MIAALFTVLLAPLFAFASWLAQPVTAMCPRGWYVNGVPTSGITSCVLAPAGRGDDECVAGGHCTFSDPLVALPLQIYCHRNASPRVLDDRRIGCVAARSERPMRQARAQRLHVKRTGTTP